MRWSRAPRRCRCRARRRGRPVPRRSGGSKPRACARRSRRAAPRSSTERPRRPRARPRPTPPRRPDNGRMAQPKTIYACTECGGTSPKWQGKCPNCGAWNTLVESVAENGGKPRFATASRGLTPVEAVATLSEIEAADAERQPTGIDELDRALGGGIVAGGVVLIGGDPGIGKSTLLLQALDALSGTMKTLYVTGEEGA